MRICVCIGKRTCYLVVKLKKMCIYYCKRREAKRSDLAVESFFPQSYWTFKQRDISETIEFFNVAYRTKMFLFDHLIDLMNWPGPAQPYHSLTGYFSVSVNYTNMKF